MTCHRYPDDDVVVRYVTGDLAEPDQSVFEDHMFACDACLARVEKLQLAQQLLAAHPEAPGPAVVPMREPRPAPPARPALLRTWGLAAAAVLVAAVAGVYTWQRAAPDTAPAAPRRSASAAGQPAPRPLPAAPTHGRSSVGLQVAVLAMVTPPPYVTLTTRSASGAAGGFATGMAAYERQDWSAAVRALQTVQTPAARFYLGIAELMRGDADAAVAALEQARASRQDPYARESAFYLGKAALQRGDVIRARQWFTAARDTGAGPDGDAARVLAALDDVAPAPRPAP